jgi:hypothetical protein
VAFTYSRKQRHVDLQRGYDGELLNENFYETPIYNKPFLPKIFSLLHSKSIPRIHNSTTMVSPELPPSLKKSLENSKAEYVRLGKSGLKISVPIMEAMSLGSKHWAPWLIEEEEVSAFFPSEICID